MADPDYFTTAEFQDLPDCSEFDEPEILKAAAYFTSIVERETGQTFVPRDITDERDGNGTATVLLSRSNVRSLTSVTVDGIAVSTGLVTARGGRLRYKTTGYGWRQPFPRGVANVTVAYSAGYDECPEDMKDSVMQATRDRLISQSGENAIDVRRTSMTNDLGGTVSYVLPGEKRPTGYPELDALIASYLRTAVPLGFA